MDRMLFAVAREYRRMATGAPRKLRREIAAYGQLFATMAAGSPERAAMLGRVLGGLDSRFLAAGLDAPPPPAVSPPRLADTLPWPSPPEIKNGLAHVNLEGDFNGTLRDRCLPAIESATGAIVVFNSLGGTGIIGLEFFHALRAKVDSLGVVRHVCASAAAFALQGCRVRLVEADAYLMVHAPLHYVGGPLAALEKGVEDLRRCQQMAGDCFERCPWPRPNWFDGRDHWYDARSAVAAGLADEVIAPVKAAAPPKAANPPHVDADAEDLAIELLFRLRREFQDGELFKVILRAFLKPDNLQPARARSAA
jgi:ATP-dependent protease ClpP protease subunit